MPTLILLTIKDLKTRFHKGNNLLKILTTIFVSMFSLCSAQSSKQKTEAVQKEITPLQIGDTIPEELWNIPVSYTHLTLPTKA